MASPVTIAALALLTTTPALAQSDDGWDTAIIDGTRFAYAEFSSGQTLSAQCQNDQFQISVTGLTTLEFDKSTGTIGAQHTVLDTDTRRVLAHLYTNTEDHPTIGVAVLPARLGRELTNRQSITLQAVGQPDIVLDVPSDFTALQALMTDCGVSASDPNDQRLMHGLSTKDVLGRAWRRNAPNYPAANFRITTQCIVASDWQLQDCQTVRQLPARPRLDAISSRPLNGSRVKPEDSAGSPLAIGDLVIFNFAVTPSTRPNR